MMQRFLSTLFLAAFLVATACGGAGKVPVVKGGDGGFPEDQLEGDVTVDGTTPSDVVVPTDETSPDVGPGCETACAGKVCGEFEECDCGSCPMQSYCSEDGTMCLGDADIGDPCTLICEATECGDVGECDCGKCDSGYICVENACELDCISQCSDEVAECGELGECYCGDCDEGYQCVEHVCEAIPPDCIAFCSDEAAECGDLGECYCGDCDEGFECVDNLCEPIPPDCDELCAGKECGTIEGCDCGQCPQGESCTEEFACACVPACDGKECGTDGCGGTCGSCGYGVCTNGICECTPNCAGKTCGANGCGGSCGSCGNKICGWDGNCHDACTPQQVPFSPVVQKLVSMQMGNNGYPGEALDVDGNPGTCSPWGKCESGLDNQLSSLFESIKQFVDINTQLNSAVNNGDIILLAELVQHNTTGLPFTMNMYLGEPAVPKGQCNFQTAKCNYLVDSGAIDWEACQPLVVFDNAKIKNNKLTAGGNGYQFGLLLPFFSGQPLLLMLYNARIEATVNIDAGGSMKFSAGVIGGAVKKQVLVDAVDDLPDQGLPVSKEMIKNLLNMLINNDIDTDGDGTKDAASMGIKFTSIPGAITGVM